MLLCLSSAVVLGLLQVLRITAALDSGSFLIFNENHNKCIKVETATSMTVAQCDPHAKEQQFRWASESRVLSLKLQLCLAAEDIKDWVKVMLFECDESSQLQHWECKNDTLFGLKDQDLHLNWGNKNERNMMIYKGSGLWSRWRIYGTKSDLCSKGFQEIFTLSGNAFGAPCQFPFKFLNKWYAECTMDGRSDKRLWCATEKDYNIKKKWGFCPTEGTSGWDTDPVTGVQYQRNSWSVLSWHQARKSCQQQGADLLSIVELHEQSYISGLTAFLGTSLWIGLNNLDFETGWQWSNGSPFRYLNWAPGHPSLQPGLNCAALNTGKASKWESNACNMKLSYICRRGNTTILPPPLIKNQPLFCPNHWVHYEGNCYYLERNKMMWRDAMAACHKEGGDLASIHNIEEQSFIFSQSGYTSTDVLWIGLNDQRNQMLFEWSDRSPVSFTYWQSNEPSHSNNLQEDCVLIRGKEGRWADIMCENMNGYICKKKASTRPSEGSQEETHPGCKSGWIRFSSYCYNIGSEKKTFNDAVQACSGAGAYLVDVADRYESAFLVSSVGLRPEKYFWTGLSNTDDKHLFKWTTRRKVTFTNFNMNMPDRKQGCVAMTTGVFAGLWDVISCSNKEKYICKKPAEGVRVTTVPPTTRPLSCASGWTPVSDRNICYKIFRKSPQLKKTWQESLDFCRALGGDLLSIHNSKDMQNSRYSISKSAWIGFSLSASKGFVWSDGSASQYEGWGFGEPNNHNDNEHCTEITSGLSWNDRHCDYYNDWICQIRKGAYPKPEPVRVLEVYNVTSDGWIIYNDTQYFINEEKLDMESARAFCKQNFGDLVIITGESERKFLWKKISRGPEKQYYIGLTVDLDKSFSWVDGSPVTFSAWEVNEPNFANNDENCVTIYKSMGYWNDINCGSELPSICKRSSDFVNTTMAPTVAPSGGCSPEWEIFQGKCYKFVLGNDKSWQNARTHCINQGGNLVSIVSHREEAFITTHMAKHNKDLWIGMNDINWEMHFVWTDGKRISYTNWAKGQPAAGPSVHYSDSEVYDCVIMIGATAKQMGLWKVDPCHVKRGFICKKNVDSQIPAPSTTVSTKTFYKLGNDSYKLVTQKMKWDEARRQCQADDADLASVLNAYSQAYITLKISKYNEPVWIGLNNNVTAGRFKWVDGWRLSFTKWGKNEPKRNYGCVYMDVDSKWKIGSCTENYYSFCKRSPDIPPAEPPQLPGHCPEPTKRVNWIPFRGHCYSFYNSFSQNWAHASVECMKIGAVLLTIEDPEESMFISENLEVLQDSSKSFWIGLYKNHKGEWMWIDNSVVDYTNWESQISNSEVCVAVSSETGQWTTTSCSRYRSYICKTAKVVTPTEKSLSIAQVIPEPYQGSPGLTVAVILVVMAAAGVGGFLFFRKKIPMPALMEGTFENKLYFNNPLRGSVDTNGLVTNIEQNEQA